MKNSILSLLVIVFAGMTATVIAQEINQGPAIEFDKDIHDYGEIAHASNGTYSFQFKNTGTEPLMITDAKGSCGCTVPAWPKTPIAPGASANIDVTYDTNRFGEFTKSVTIMSNAVNTPVKVIQIKGSVLAKEADPLVEGAVPQIQVVEEMVPPVKEEMAPPVIEEVPMTEAEMKAEAKRVKKENKKAEKAKKKAAKLALKMEKQALKAEAK